MFLPGKSHVRGAWHAVVHRVSKEVDMTWRLNNSNNNWFTVGLLIFSKPTVMSRLDVEVGWECFDLSTNQNSLTSVTGGEIYGPQSPWMRIPCTWNDTSGFWLNYRWMSPGYPALMNTVLLNHPLSRDITPVETTQRFGALAPSSDFLGDVGVISTLSYLDKTFCSLRTSGNTMLSTYNTTHGRKSRILDFKKCHLEN